MPRRPAIALTDDELRALPEDPIAAFVETVTVLLERFEEAAANLEPDTSHWTIYRDFMYAALPAAQRYRIEELESWDRPSQDDETMDLFNRFKSDVEYAYHTHRLEVQATIRNETVALNQAAKLKVQHLLQELREAVSASALPVDKQDRLMKWINKLQAEIDRERTNVQAAGALWLELCGLAGDGADKLEPVVRVVERIGAAIGIAREAEQASLPRLPKRKPTKQIEPPKKRDEIPF